ncbi:MAG: hypothetical protein CMM93_07320 [Rickettsiales bacterium]|nr:hypothetical protein [Rickettsiales bacterium]
MADIHSLEEKAPSHLLRPHGITILAVEDDRVAMGFLEAQIENMGHETLTARHGEEALEVLKQHRDQIDVVLMDRNMPVMDGLTAIRRMKEDATLRHIPVIMVTGADSLSEMKEGLEAGVFYYLTKPVQPEMLHSVLAAALREARQVRSLAKELGKHRTSFDLIETCRFHFRTLTQAENLAAFMANCFPDPTRVVSGLGELLINAVEHGNLGVSYDEKSELIEYGTWQAEIERRQQSPEYAERQATATLARKDNGVYAIVEDEGKGFDWKKYLTIDPARAGDNHGRGIAQARAISFDKLTYNESGNKVIAYVSNIPQLEW